MSAKETTELIKAIAAILSAVAWPSVFVVVVLLFKSQLKGLLGELPNLVGRLRKMKALGIEAELEAASSGASTSGAITLSQKLAAENIAIVTDSGSRSEVYRRLDQLCRRFETVRRTMVAGYDRTVEMSKIIAQMRALAPSTSDRLEIYKGSGSVGARLAAIAMMQMEPEIADISWLIERFRSDPPFVFYHAALALNNLRDLADPSNSTMVCTAAREALDIVNAFDGVSDAQTIDVLEEILKSCN